MNLMAPKSVFVVMPFRTTKHNTSSGWKDFFEKHLVPAALEAGYECERSELRRGSVISSILHSLASSRVVLADLTDDNPNVYYELGVRHALTRRSITICHKGTFVASDLRSYWYCEYDLGSRASIKLLRRFITDALNEIDEEPSAPDNPVADYLQKHRVRTTKIDQDHYELAIRLVAEAERRLFLVERTPVLLLKDIRYDYHRHWHDGLEHWIQQASQFPQRKRFGMLFVLADTRNAIKSRDSRQLFEANLHHFKSLEASGGVTIRCMPTYSGSFIVSDDKVGIWYKTSTNEIGLNIMEMPELADAYEDVFHRLAGEINQPVDEVMRALR